MARRLLLTLAMVVFASVVDRGMARTQTESLPLTWWLAGATVKILPQESPPADPPSGLTLYAARQEYAPFQLVFRADQTSITVDSVAVDYPVDYFDVTLYHEQFIDLVHIPSPEIFSLARLIGVEALPDGLRPLEIPFVVETERVSVVWVDLFVRPGTPPGEYTVRLQAGEAGEREVRVVVFPVDLDPLPAMNIIIPEEVDWTIAFYGGDDPAGFHRELNNLLLEHGITPGTFLALPVVTADGWDFSALDAELAALPPGSLFYAPLPYVVRTGQYLLRGESGQFYTEAHFEDPRFVQQAEAFFAALADYLRSQNRLQGALVYPVDETRWVGDEPLHGGPGGFARLADWTRAARSAGLRVTASGVTPVPPGPLELGWPEASTVTDDTHVHVDIFDAAPALFADWMAQPGRTSSVYLNEYGDLLDMPAAVQRGLIWHVYARGSRMIAGYSALEWVDNQYNLVQMWTDPTPLYPESGYGGGALVWPGPLPSIRLKLLREGVEDARLLDRYAAITDVHQAQDVAARLTPGALADQNPAPDLWDNAHRALLEAISEDKPVDIQAFLPQPPVYTEIAPLLDMDGSAANLGDWDFEGASGEIVESPWNSGNALQVHFTADIGQAGFWFGESNWDHWQALQVDVKSLDPYFSLLDVGLTDADGNYVLLRNGAIIIGPQMQQTLTMPLVLPLDYTDSFDWSRIKYISLEVNTATEQKDGFGNVALHRIGDRTLVFDNFRLIR